MVIYIECVLINNFAIDALMGYITLLTLRRRVQWWRVGIMATLGSIYALFSPLIEFKGDIVVKIAVAFVLCLILAPPMNIKKYLIMSLVFLGYSFAFGGILIGLMNMSQPIREVLTYPNNINIGLGCTLFLLVLIFVRICLRSIIKKKIKEGNVKKVIINISQKVIKEKGYYDSGNTMYYRGIYPVIVMDESLKCDDKAVGMIDVNTISGEVKKDVYRVGKIMIENRAYDGVYCIYNKLDSGYKVLLHNDTY